MKAIRNRILVVAMAVAAIGLLAGHRVYLDWRIRHEIAKMIRHAGCMTTEGKEAGQRLAGIGRAAVPPLMELLHDESTPPKGMFWAPPDAAWALGEIGPSAQEAVPALVEALDRRTQDPYKDASFLATHAAGALWRIARHPRSVPKLVEGLDQSQDDSISCLSARLIGDISVGCEPPFIDTFPCSATILMAIFFDPNSFTSFSMFN